MNSGIDEGVQIIPTADDLNSLVPAMHARVNNFVQTIVLHYSNQLHWTPNSVAVVLAKVLFEAGGMGLCVQFTQDDTDVYRRINEARDTLMDGLWPAVGN